MAYLAFQELGGIAALRSARLSPPGETPAGDDRLSDLEWSVVQIARRDGRASLRRPGRLATAVAAILRRPNPRLADDKLEALRRLAVTIWHDGDLVPASERRRFLAAGFSPGQYETLTAGIGVGMRERAATRPR